MTHRTFADLIVSKGHHQQKRKNFTKNLSFALKLVIIVIVNL